MVDRMPMMEWEMVQSARMHPALTRLLDTRVPYIWVAGTVRGYLRPVRQDMCTAV